MLDQFWDEYNKYNSCKVFVLNVNQRKNLKNLKEWILKETNFLLEKNIKSHLGESIFCIVNNIKEIQKCEYGSIKKYADYKYRCINGCKCISDKKSKASKENQDNLSSTMISLCINHKRILSDIELKENLILLLKTWNNDSKLFGISLKSNKKLLPELFQRTIYLSENTPQKERVFHVLNDLFEPIICINGNYNSFIEGKYVFCGLPSLCKCLSEHINNSDVIKNKNLKMVETCNKIEQGSTNPSQWNETKNKISIKQQEINNNPLLQIKKTEKRNLTNNIKYGISEILQSDSHIRVIRDQIMIEKYGTIYYSQTSESKIKSSEKRLQNKYNQLLNDEDFIPLFSLVEYIGVKNYKKYSFQCKKCKNKFDASIDDGMKPICRICNPPYSIGSIKQKEIYNLIKELVPNEQVFYNDRTIISGENGIYKELDIYIPSKNFAIEYCGNYWHSDLYKEKNYHYEKYKLCNEKGINLFTILETEWKNKKEIIIKRIKHALGISEKIYARKTIIKNISSNIAKEFLEKNHLNGFCGATYHYGLFYINDLVAVMSIGKTRFNKNKHYEIIRFASNIHVVGGLSKLFKYFIKQVNPDNVITYTDLRYGAGAGYEKIGFKKLKIISPGYWYITNKGIQHRLNYTKKKLVLDGFDINKTEFQIMDDLGILRFWDCGNNEFLWEKSLTIF